MEKEMYINGLQHIGIPTERMEDSITFYGELGFNEIYKLYYKPKEQWICFMELGGLMIELYEEKGNAVDGAINHFSLNCLDIHKEYARIATLGYQVISDGIEDMDIWTNGVKFFIISGPNRERIEFCQRLN